MLVALTICLGAKATFTNRGKKLTEFIRGTARFHFSLLAQYLLLEKHLTRLLSSYASISVTLKNCGSEAYRYEGSELFL